MRREPGYRTIRRQPGGTAAGRPVVTCAVCGFRGQSSEHPAVQRLGPHPALVTGTTYVGATADADVRTFDKAVQVIHPPGTCSFCGAEMYLSGSRGSGHRLP